MSSRKLWNTGFLKERDWMLQKVKMSSLSAASKICWYAPYFWTESFRRGNKSICQLRWLSGCYKDTLNTTINIQSLTPLTDNVSVWCPYKIRIPTSLYQKKVYRYVLGSKIYRASKDLEDMPRSTRHLRNLPDIPRLSTEHPEQI